MFDSIAPSPLFIYQSYTILSFSAPVTKKDIIMLLFHYLHFSLTPFYPISDNEHIWLVFFTINPETQKQYLKKSCCTICLHLWMSPFWKMLFDWIELVWIPFKTLTHHLSLSSVLHSLSILTHLLSEVIKIIFTISPSRGGESPPHYHSCLRGWLWDGRSSATELSLGRPSRLSLLMAAWGWIAAHLIPYYWISLFPHCCQSSLHLLPKR